MSDDERYAELTRRLGHDFADAGLLHRALTHDSWTQEGGEAGSYERLEFLGDAVLGLLAADWLYRHLDDSDEGELSKLKSYVVSEPVLAGYAQELGLGPLLRLGVGEEKSGGREKRSLLADALEALIGALYLDGGLEVARRMTAELLPRSVAAFRAGAQWRDPKTSLQERLQAEGGEPPEYRLTGTSGPDHQKQFVVECWSAGSRLGRGQGSSKKRAEQAAAAEALAALQSGDTEPA